MPRYAALLRGVSPVNAKMSALRAAFEAAGFEAVQTLLSSGNVIFDVPRVIPDARLGARAERAMQAGMGRSFMTFVRPLRALAALLDDDPFAGERLAPGAKRVVTFLPAPPGRVALPPATLGARILGVRGREAFTAYVPGPQGPVFMKLIDQTFGKDNTTRTWDTVRKLVRHL